MRIDKGNIQHWNEVADSYSADLQDGKSDLAMIYQPSIDELLGNVCGKRILDAGCGEGYYSRELASKNALVAGIDGSKSMIAIAEFARILKKNGSLVFFITHPCFFCFD